MDTITVNGPEDILDWDAVVWRAHEENVARLRRRIFTATREQHWAMARSLQKDPLPVRRVYVPKANGKQRPLGIPVSGLSISLPGA